MLAGNPGRRPLNPREPQPPIPTELPEPPLLLSPVARQEWIRTGGLLLRSRVLTEADLTAFAAYCVVYGRWVQAERDIDRKGILVRPTPGSKVRILNPMLPVANKCLQQMLQLQAEFGLTPSSRTRVVVVDASQDDAERRKAARYFGPQPIRPAPDR
jgi:P27 family predicted phage terminase small subunit